MTNHYTDVCEETIKSLRQQLAEVKEEKARGAAAALLTVQHDYQEIKSLKFQLVELDKQVTLLRDAAKEGVK